MSISWGNMIICIYPPIYLIPKILWHMTWNSVSVSNNSHCARVHRSIADTYRHTNRVSTKERFVSLSKVKHLPSRIKTFQSNGRAFINRNLKKKALKTQKTLIKLMEKKEHRLIRTVNSKSSVVGVINGIKIHIQYL